MCFLFYGHLLISPPPNNKVFTSYVLGIGTSYAVPNLTECVSILAIIMKTLVVERILNSCMAKLSNVPHKT